MPTPRSDEDQPLFLKGRVGLRDRERVGAIFGGEAAHGRKRIAVAHLAVEDGRRDAVAQAKVNGTIV
jgi:hypothetical protein